TADNQLVGPWSLDVQVFVDDQLAAGEHDGMPLELVRKVDSCAARGGGDGRSERSGRAIIESAGDGHGAGHRARFEHIDLEADPPAVVAALRGRACALGARTGEK